MGNGLDSPLACTKDNTMTFCHSSWKPKSKLDARNEKVDLSKQRDVEGLVAAVSSKAGRKIDMCREEPEAHASGACLLP